MWDKRTLRQVIAEECIKNNEVFENLTIAVGDGELDEEFGVEECPAFTAWSTEYVYFPIYNDGYAGVGSVIRNPCEFRTQPQGE